MNLMPIDMKVTLVSYFKPAYYTSSEVKKVANQLTRLSSVNLEFMSLSSEKLANLKKIDALIKKYPKYSFDYEMACNQWEEHHGNPSPDWEDVIMDPKGSPELLDALGTGYDSLITKSTFKTYTLEIEEDIKEIVKLNPQSLTSDYGEKRCESRLTPLYVACLNVNIPLHIVDFLLINGADPRASLMVNGHLTPLNKLVVWIKGERGKGILELLIKHGIVK